MATAAKLSNEEIASKLIELVNSDLDRTMSLMAAILEAKRKAAGDSDLLKEVQRGSDALRLETNRWRVVPVKADKSAEHEAVAKLLQG